MQDHTPYLDAESRALEVAVLAPLWLAGQRLHDRANGPPVDVAIALLWGAFVGLIKAQRLGYLPLDEQRFAQAGAACWRMIAPAASRATASTASPPVPATASPPGRAPGSPPERATPSPPRATA